MRRQAEAGIVELASRMRRARTSQSRERYRRRIDEIRGRIQKRAAKGRGPVDFIFRKEVRIPARPFINWNSNDQKEFDQTVNNIVLDIINGR